MEAAPSIAFPANAPSPVEAKRALSKRLWKNTGLVLLSVYPFIVVYVVLLEGAFSFFSFAKSIAGTASIAFALSFSLSSFGYYLDTFDSKVIYRKYFGLAGYFLSVFYAFLLLFTQPDFYFFGFFKNFWTPDIFLGLLTLTIFTFMAVISNDAATRFMGPKLWRNSLRLGYLAYFLLVLRAACLEFDHWGTWLQSSFSLPSVRFLLSALALTVIFFRVSIFFSKKRRQGAVSLSQSSTF